MKRKALLPTLVLALVLALGLTGTAAVYAAGGGTVAQAEGEAPAAITLNEHEHKYYALPNGKGWTEMKTAYENALNAVNAEIKAIKDGGGDLAEAVASGRIPFYSGVNDGYITGSNLEGGNKYGEEWVNSNIAQDALPIYNLTEGFEPSSRSKYCALVVFNAKAEDTTGTNGVAFVTGEFAAKWKDNKSKLGLANGKRFTVGDTVYQNFQRGYLKKTGTGSVDLVQDKNVDAEGHEQAADLNAFGWFGASGQVGGNKVDGNGNPMNKNKIGATTEEEVKAFSAMASKYYDDLRKAGYNLGYGTNSEISFGYGKIRNLNPYPFDNLFHGSSVADPWNRDSDKNWSVIAYNQEMKKLFLCRDEIVNKMDESTETFQRFGALGAPSSELFAVKKDSKRYQTFANGYVVVDGLTAENKKDNVVLQQSTESGYVDLKTQIKNAYTALKTGSEVEAAKAATDKYTPDSYAAFTAAYDKTVADDATIEEIAAVYNELYDTFRGLRDPEGDLTAVKAQITEVETNVESNPRYYTGASFAAFTAAYDEAKDLPEGTASEKMDKTDALRAAVAFLQSLEAYLAAIPKIGLTEYGDKYYALPTGKTWEDLKAAYDNALNAINQEIGKIIDGRTLDAAKDDLDAAIACRRIPFYSNINGGFISAANLNKEGGYGEQWLHDNIVHDALLVYNLSEGFEPPFRSNFGALVVFNAKATDTTGTNGVVFVTGKFAEKWSESKKELGLAGGNTFTVDGAVYQNFQRGYLKKTGDGAVEVVRYKNVDPANGKERAADLDALGWFGAVGQIGGKKNVMGFTEAADAVAFSQKLTAYYNSLLASGLNPGYPQENEIIFGMQKIRSTDYPLTSFYHGNMSVAHPWGDSRENWTVIAYNKTLQQFFTLTDEVVFALDKGEDNGNYQGIIDLGAPTSELLVFRTVGKRYQTFTNGYVEIDGLKPINACGNLTVHNKTDEGYVALETYVAGYYTDLAARAKEVSDADNGDGVYTAESFTAFTTAYRALEAFDTTDKTAVEITAAYNALYAAYIKLITAEVQTAYDAAYQKVIAITDNDGHTYSADSYAAFAAAKETALAMPDDSSDDMIAKTEALNAAYALLVTTESQYVIVKAEIDALLADEADYTGTSFAAFKVAVEAVGTPTTGEAMYQAIIDLTAAKALLEARAEMSELGVAGTTIEVDEEITLTVGGNGDGQVTVTVVSGDAVTVDGLKLTAVKAGTVVLKVTKAGGDRYFDKSVEITVTVDKKAQAAPETPEIESVTGSTIVVKAIEGAEYRLGADGTWQTSNVFENLDALTEYTVYVRYAETDTSYASGPVSVTATTTAAADGKKGCGCGSELGASAWPFGLLTVGLAALVTVALRRRKA